MSKECSICHKKTNWLNNTSLLDGVLCNDCAHKIGIENKFNSDKVPLKIAKRAYDNSKTINLKQLLKEQHTENKKQKESNNIEYKKIKQEFIDDHSYRCQRLYMDGKKKKILLDKTLFDRYFVYNYKDFTGYKKIIIPTTIKKHHGIARGITGGILAGPGGAIVGAVTGGKQYEAVSKLGIILFFKNGVRKEIDFVKTAEKTNGFIYQTDYKEFLTLSNKLDDVTQYNAENSTQPSKKIAPKQGLSNSADEIRKYKSLADDGIITQAEFEAKKKQLLGL